MKIILMLACCFAMHAATAQELFTYSEPASNMPSKSFALRANNYLMQNKASGNYSYAFAPEIMLGVSKKLMFHAESFFGNDVSRFKFDGASVYAKYRFYSEDEVHTHFRMSLYGKAAVSNNAILQPAIDLAGRNSGAELGIVTTKLLNRLALSAGGSFVTAFNNAGSNKFPGGFPGKNAFSYNLAVGRLILPVEYKSYEQANVNIMLEMLGQTNTTTGHTFIDLAPSLQFILLSKIRLDAGYRFPVVTSLSRISERGFLMRIEYNFFSFFK
jgi:hypothetical protein